MRHHCSQHSTRRRLLGFAAAAAPILAVAAFIALLLWAALVEEQPCADWAAEAGLEDRAVALACEVGPGSGSDRLSEPEFRDRMNAGLNRVADFLDEDKNL